MSLAGRHRRNRACALPSTISFILKISAVVNVNSLGFNDVSGHNALYMEEHPLGPVPKAWASAVSVGGKVNPK